MLTRRQLLAATLGLAALPLAPHPTTATQNPESGASIDAPLRDYLAATPLSIANPDWGYPVLLYGNPLLQSQTLGIPLPFDFDDDEQRTIWNNGMANVPIPEILRRTNMLVGLKRFAGYELSQVFSGAEIGAPANMITFVRGDFDSDAIVPIMEINGYQPIQRDGHTVLVADRDTLRPPTGPTIEAIPERLSNATFLDDDTLVYAPSLDLIDAVLAPGATLLDLPAVANAIDTLDEPLIAAALAGPGALLPHQPFDETPVNDPALVPTIWPQDSPVVLVAIIGSTAGGPIETFATGATPIPVPSAPISRSKFALTYASTDDANTAATQIEERLATESSIFYELPWSELFTTWSVTPNEPNASVLVTIEWSALPSKALTLLYRRDLSFITG